MADLDFFFDPVSPWAWITSRWVTKVQALRQYEVSWKFISLRMINADRGYEPDSPYEKIHNIGLQGRREALKLWDAVQALAESGVAEFKRSLRAAPDFT